MINRQQIDRRQIIDQIFGLHAPDDLIVRRAMRLLKEDGVDTARAYLELIDMVQRREIASGVRQPSIRITSRPQVAL